MKQTIRHLTLFFILSTTGFAGQIPRPEDVFGFPPGDDYKLADYQQMREYYHRLDASSDRIRVFDIGPTAEGRQMMLAIISSEANMAKLQEYREISEKLARARISPEKARQLADKGRTIVWIDGGLHATEVAHAQHSPELSYRVVTEESSEMQFVRDNVVLLQVPVMNPDGLNIVVQWYERNLGTEFETSPLPRLYHKYVGHDNNRDWYMITQPETQNVSRILYEEWYPQIVYNHHQSAPFPARIFVPPFAPPMNPNIPALVLRGIDLVGSAMSARFEAEEKPGVISRISYTTWWNGGMRTTPYFHNMVGILTETALYGYATPHEYEKDGLPKSFRNTLPTLEPSADYPNPWQGGWWRLRDAVDYMMTASMAVLDVAARHRNQWLYSMYLMGRQSIEKGQTEAPGAYLVPPDQHDPSAAAALIRTLSRGGLEIYQAESHFQAEGKHYPKGTYIVYTAQAFRPHLIDLMEPQKYVTRRLHPGGPPIRPYDVTGWTLPTQMGVRTIRIAEPFELAAQPITEARLPQAPAVGPGRAFLIDRRWNSSYRLVNELLSQGLTLRVSSKEIHHKEKVFPPGCFIVDQGAVSLVQELSERHRTPVYSLKSEIEDALTVLKRPRIGVYQSAVSNVDEGWTRWLLDQYQFDYESISNRGIRLGRLRDRFEVIVLPSQSPERMMTGHRPGSVPPEYAGGMGIEGFTELKGFVEEGGVLVTLDAACQLPVNYFDLPVQNVLEGVKSTDFYCPGSLLRLIVDVRDPVGYGMSEKAAAFFVKSLAFDLGYGSDRSAQANDFRERYPQETISHRVARYGDEEILLSGGILGEKKIRNKSAVVRVKLGRGQVIMLGFRTHFRGQPHGTFKLLFNSIYLGGMLS
ncbi:M14 family metallopeptidase [Acidobacteria bacterium AH-259-G07]|nr:M14 family metallopeptidase [Acidobacteria bacterium AH-259-G07]